MTMPHQAEGNANNVLGNLLRPMLGKASVLFESTRVIAGSSGKKPDIVITATGRSPVVIEAEYDPARNAEAEAEERLGKQVKDVSRPIEAVIALRYPAGLDDAYDQRAVIAHAPLSYCVFTVERYGPPPAREILSVARFPESGWLEGSVSDLADLVRLVSVPQLAVYSAADSLQGGIQRVAEILDELENSQSAINAAIARLLGMENVPQTRRMAGAILANAMVFHERIAGIHENIKPLNLVCGPDVANPQGETLAAWAEILKINYWPIFAIGRDILQQIPVVQANRTLGVLQSRVGEVGGAGVDNAHDLTGRVFQRLIADRKYLATFYTLPSSAALLARLAVSKLDGIDWGDVDAIGRLRIADFACGTGALLSAVYEQIAARHERAGGDPAGIHPAMMEEVLYGCDVMPSAIHITGSTLSGMQPNIGFGNSRLYTMPYGRQEDGSVKIGSLEFLQSSSAWVLFNTSDPALRTGSAGEETAAQILADVPDNGFDLVIMNPPFTSNTKHYDADDGVLNAAFAAFDASKTDQDDMATRMGQRTRDTCYHGHAGLGSAFAALADRKVRPGGVAAFVLPFTAINGASWKKLRELIATKYTDITIISIAENGKDMSFSSDTGMAECLVVGRKGRRNDEPRNRGSFVSLRRRPRSFAEALEVSKSMVAYRGARRLEDGPYGGGPIYCGARVAGESLDVPMGSYQTGWGAARILDASVAQVAHSLSVGELWLPANLSSRKLPIARLKQLGRRGLDHQLLISVAHKGPFSKAPASPTATYPSLWNHNAKNETRLLCVPDLQLLVRSGMEAKSAEVWATASRAHINSEFTFGSQALAVAFTERVSLGGRVWPNVSFDDKRFDYAFAAWANGTLGLLSHWWHSSRQQSSKAGITINLAELLPVLDFRELSDDQLATAEGIFDEFRELDLLPAYLADADPNRALLDRRVVCDLLGFDEDVYRGVRRLAAKWCAEPSVHGGKARPRSARYVE